MVQMYIGEPRIGAPITSLVGGQLVGLVIYPYTIGDRGDMPTCPLCKKFFPFEMIGITNILEGEDAEEFWRNEKKSATPEQVEFFKEAIKVYRDSVKSGRFKMCGEE